MNNSFLSILKIILFIMLAGYLLNSLYYFIKNEKQFFSMEVLNKSFFTMGILATILIALVAGVVFILQR
jgi:hypothetical protein